MISCLSSNLHFPRFPGFPRGQGLAATDDRAGAGHFQPFLNFPETAMKIAFLDPSHLDYTVESVYQIPLGGSQSALCYLAESLAKQGHEIFLFNNTTNSGKFRGVNCLGLPLKPKADLLRSLDALIAVNVAGEGIKLRPLLGDKTRMMLWTQQLPSLQAMRNLHQLPERESYDRFIFVSQWQRDRFVEYFGIDAAKTTILRNAIAPAFQNLFPPETSILSHKSHPPVLAYTSTPFRGLDLLIDIFPKIRQAIPGTRLKVFSSKRVYQLPDDIEQNAYGPLYQKCRDMEGVEYFGSIPQPALARELRSVTALTYANTFQETSCISVMEAMASGCRIITSNLAALPETTAGFARLVSVEDVRSFSSVRNWQFSVKEDWQAYSDRFLSATLELLNQTDANSTEKLLRQQVDYLNRCCTWEMRGKEWAQWLSQVCDATVSWPDSNTVEALNEQAQEYFRCGNLDAAIATCQQSLKLNPAVAQTYKLLGNFLQSQGKIDPAIRAYSHAISLQPDFAEAQANLGSMYYQKGNLSAAKACYETAIARNGNLSGAYWNLGKVLHQLGQFQEAIAAQEKALDLNPQQFDAAAYSEVGSAILLSGNLEASRQFYRKFVQRQPDFAPAYLNLGTVLKKQGQLEAAIAHFRIAVQKQPNLSVAYYNLGNALGELGKTEEAIASFRTYLAGKPNDAEAYYRLGSALATHNQSEAAIAAFKKAIELKPDFARAYYKIGEVLQQQAQQQQWLDREKVMQAIASFERAIELQPDWLDAHQSLFNLLITSRDFSGNLSLLSQARDAADRFIESCGKQHPVLSKLAYIKAYQWSGLSQLALEKFATLESRLLGENSALSEVEIGKLYKSFLFNMPHLRDNLAANSTLARVLGDLYGQILSPAHSFAYPEARRSPSPSNSTLTIAVLSENFRKHSVGWCSYAAIEALSQLDCRLFLYATGNLQPDSLTEKFKGCCERLVIPPSYHGEEIIELILQESPDIILDLDSLTVPVHAEILQAKPAPICMSWLGFDAPYISSDNYFLGDWYSHPIGTERYYREKLVRMPHSFVAIAGFERIGGDRHSLRTALGISDAQTVYLCVAPGRKLNPDLIRAQVRILQQVPESLLLYKGEGDTAVIQARYQQECEAIGVSFARIKFLPRTRTEEEHRSTYVIADVLLDSYPYNGGTHTLESLWFDLPVVTRSGEQYLSRMGYSFLKAAGIEAGVAWSWEEYVRWGVRFGKEREFCQAIKQQLGRSKQPEQLAPLWNSPQFARDMYGIFQQLLHPTQSAKQP
ncbi:tetratricopeptide repeat protein [Phormidium sp. CCY1219]|uniref:tetratricopeptide repeat protein n=1 Tax=Phormidium sp. CCY1219 TaxID=2886104 RepID=UPI002D1E5DDC|nr:tetratricopeptide repeat protein [Phormidium sp. CCY1219]MEB3830495.1 tetratricopeptide repeat protein [Phormidium sp. CCY1219]